MPWHLATDVNIRQLPVQEQLYAFAYAYLEAATNLNTVAVSQADRRDWPRGAVVLMNAAHAVELFLKASILRRDQQVNIWAAGHNIRSLAEKFSRLYPDLNWEVPFQGLSPDELSTDEQKVLREGTAPASIEFRYPVNKQGHPWLALQGFEPHSFARDLERLERDFDRIYYGAA